jgi:hypothetical protein
METRGHGDALGGDDEHQRKGIRMGHEFMLSQAFPPRSDRITLSAVAVRTAGPEPVGSSA